LTDDPFLHLIPPAGGVGGVTGVALLLHGGRSESFDPVTARQLAVLRMKPFVTALRRAGGESGLAVARLRYLVRGWNGPARSPLADVEWALETLAGKHPGVPIAVVGHSMGGRAAIYTAGHPAVSAVVGLAPWLEKGDPHDQLAGRRLLLAHAPEDAVTSAEASRRFADRAAAVAASVGYVSITNEKHSMMRRARVWHDLAAGFVTGVFYDRVPGETAGPRTAKVLQEALAGQRSLVL
jgi:pimeloyl-ACP methyl ester carboxylesterase